MHWRDRRIDFECRISDISQAMLWVLREAMLQHVANACRYRLGQRLPVGLAFENRDQDVGNRRTWKGGPTREHLEQDAAKRPDIRTFVDRLAARLFRTHVTCSADNQPILRLA